MVLTINLNYFYLQRKQNLDFDEFSIKKWSFISYNLYNYNQTQIIKNSKIQLILIIKLKYYYFKKIYFGNDVIKLRISKRPKNFASNPKNFFLIVIKNGKWIH